MSILFPDAGSVSVLGHTSALMAKDRIGYLPEERGLYRKMRVGEFLTYIARLKDVADAESRAAIAKALERLGLTASVDKRCEELSKGMPKICRGATVVRIRGVPPYCCDCSCVLNTSVH